jgi:hypothetical protein
LKNKEKERKKERKKGYACGRVEINFSLSSAPEQKGPFGALQIKHRLLSHPLWRLLLSPNRKWNAGRTL